MCYPLSLIEMNKSGFKMDLALFTDLLSFFAQEMYIYGAFYGVMFECCLSQGALTLGLLKFLLIFFPACSKSFKYDSCLKSCFIGSNHLVIKVFFPQLGVKKKVSFCESFRRLTQCATFIKSCTVYIKLGLGDCD